MGAASRSTAFVLSLGGCLALLFASVQTSARQTPAPAAQASFDTRTTVQPLLDKYCITCHNQRLRTAGLTLDAADVAAPASNAELWERVIAKLARAFDAAGGTAAPRHRHLRRSRVVTQSARSMQRGSRIRIRVASAPCIASTAVEYNECDPRSLLARRGRHVAVARR
jgi:hypothetical protein